MNYEEELTCQVYRYSENSGRKTSESTYDQSQRIDIRRFGNTFPTLPFRTPPHDVAHGVRSPERLFVLKFQGQVKVTQGNVLNFRLALVIICPVDQDIIGLHILNDRPVPS